MQKRMLTNAGPSISVLGLGGHEFYPDGRIKGFSDDRENAVRPGYTQRGFGGPDRLALLRRAIDLGVQFFDTTIDPEIEALGRNLREVDRELPPTDILVQARPQGMCYGYDPLNRKMADQKLLIGEVDRIRALLGRERIDVLNFAFKTEALQSDPDYLDKIEANILALKESGRIRFAACDGLGSGEPHYLHVMERGCFDVVWISFSPLSPFPSERVLPLAKDLGMGVLTREAFSKGRLFDLAKKVAADRLEFRADKLSGVVLRWILQHREVTSVAVGVRDIPQLETNAHAVSEEYSDNDREVIERLMGDPNFKEALERARKRFQR